MKILFSPAHYIFDGYYTGSEPYWAYNIADKIASQYPLSVIVTGSKKIIGQKKYKIVEVQKNKTNIDVTIWSALKFNLKYFLATNKQIKQQRFDIVHHVLPFGIDSTFNLSLLLKKIKNTPFIIGPIQSPLSYKDTDVDLSNIRNFKKKDKLDLNFDNYIQSLLKPVLKFLSNETLRKANKIIVVNQYTKKLLLNRSIPSEKIEIIAPGIDTERFKYIPFREKNSDVIEIITVGFLIKRKGLDLIIRAIKEVIEVNKNIRLRIIGDGPQMKSLKKLSSEMGLDNYVLFEGFIPNNKVQEYYQKAHIFVNMSRSEGFATVCLEAMASGLAIISSKVGGFLDAINNERNGYLIEQEDYKMLAEKINYLIKNKHLISKFGQRARKEAEEKYDWDKVIIPKYLKVYKSLIK